MLETLYLEGVVPTPKPRQTQSDRWGKRPCVVAYRHYADCVRERLGIERGESFDLPQPCTITFGMPMPKTWSKKKRITLLGTPHQSKPDIDNLAKGFLDAILPDDSQVWNIRLIKLWSPQPFIQIDYQREPE